MTKLNFKKLVRNWLSPVIWMGVIFGFSSIPTVATSEIYWQDFVIKKTAHMIEYAILTLFLYRSFRLSGKSLKKAIFYSILISVLYAMTDEFHQSFTPGREPRVRDIAFDTLGSFVAGYVTMKRS